MPENNDNSDTVYSFETAYVPVQDHSGRCVLMETSSLIIMTSDSSTNTYTAYADRALNEEYAERILDRNITVTNPWDPETQSSAHNIDGARNYGWHFVADRDSTSNVLVNNIDQFMVESLDDIPDEDLSDGLFEDTTFKPEPITEDELMFENSAIVETDDEVIEFDPESAVLVPSSESDSYMYIICEQYNGLIGRADVFRLEYGLSDTYASFENHSPIDYDYISVKVPVNADIHTSELMPSLSDEVKFKNIYSGQGVVFERKTVRDNEILTERFVGYVTEVLDSNGSVKGYSVTTENGTETDVPATSVVWAAWNTSAIPEWAT